jgi:Domain of unknown function (DUF4345)
METNILPVIVSVLPQLAISLIAFGFAAMGMIALVKPKRVTRQFGIPTLDADGRNEVRAVYGGFGLGMAVVLVIAMTSVNVRTGICLTVGAALLSMAVGRVISSVMDWVFGRIPLTYLLIELFGAALLFYAA